jgi:Flp pilus assembly protein TadD
MSWRHFVVAAVCTVLGVWAQDPANLAYAALKARRYEEAAGHFRRALAGGSGKPYIHKDFAYALLKMGEREEARDQFGKAWSIAPDDTQAGLEFAFLCYETKRERDARRAFDRLRKSGVAEAEKAFENVDRPLREGIARWTHAVAAAPDQWSAHEELAILAEKRDELALAEEHYLKAWRLRPRKRELLLDYARVADEAGKVEEAKAARLSASRSESARVVELARRNLPERYPYVYEFENALNLDPGNEMLRREYGFLLIEMKKAPKEAPKPSAKEMGLRSYEKSFLPDAARYLRIAHEQSPNDSEVMVKLGETYNLLGDDRQALRWFDAARKAGDAGAREAYERLRPDFARVKLSMWALPFYSSRWEDAFLYGQFKSEFRFGKSRVRPYLTMRFVGDVRGRGNIDPFMPQLRAYFSENAVILGGGVGIPLGRRLYAWGEAGESWSYLGRRPDAGILMPDYRGGVSWRKLWGRESGLFNESGLDGVYVSRFRHDTLAYSTNRTGWGFGERVRLQLYAAWNVTADTKREYWANYVEAGPGMRLRWEGLPTGVHLRVEFLRGATLVNRVNPLPPNYWDLRAGLWYAVAR